MLFCFVNRRLVDLTLYIYFLYKQNFIFFSWAGGRAAPANIQPEDFDPCLCTHVLYSFVPMSNNQVVPSWSDTCIFFFLDLDSKEK